MKLKCKSNALRLSEDEFQRCLSEMDSPPVKLKTMVMKQGANAIDKIRDFGSATK